MISLKGSFNISNLNYKKITKKNQDTSQFFFTNLDSFKYNYYEPSPKKEEGKFVLIKIKKNKKTCRRKCNKKKNKKQCKKKKCKDKVLSAGKHRPNYHRLLIRDTLATDSTCDPGKAKWSGNGVSVTCAISKNCQQMTSLTKNHKIFFRLQMWY